MQGLTRREEAIRKMVFADQRQRRAEEGCMRERMQDLGQVVQRK